MRWFQFGFPLLGLLPLAMPLFCTDHSSQRTAASSDPISYVAASPEAYLNLSKEVNATLDRDVLGVWFPRALDTQRGGFFSNFSHEWKPFGTESKYSVFQGRMTWICSQIVRRRPELKQQYVPCVKHGVDYLTGPLWDKEKGGFFWGLSEKGEISPFYSDGKQLYGMSFALYGLAAAYESTNDPRALEYAQKGFHWIEEHAHDSKNGGYFEYLTRDGRPFEAHPETGVLELAPVSGFPVGYKSMNTHIHLLESFAQLYRVWKDDLLRQRLGQLLVLVRDKICVEPGMMNLYFTDTWQPLPGHDSYGHDVETAYLMLEAEETLANGHDPRTERMARMLVDHALHYGWDQKFGGFYQEGSATGSAELTIKEWWVQFEGLNALLLMHELYGAQTDVYFKAFQLQWNFIQQYQVDSTFHGVYESVAADGRPTADLKGSIWKAAYHDGRALLNVSERLNRLAESAARK